MDETEVDRILTQLSGLKDELTEGRIGLKYPHKSDNFTESETCRKLSDTICDIRRLIETLYCSCADQGSDVRGIKLVTSILNDIRTVCRCDHDYEVVDHGSSIQKETNLSEEMTKCVDEAYAALDECKKLRRYPQDSKEDSTKESKSGLQRQENLDEKKVKRFVSKTKDDAFQLYEKFFGKNFLECDEFDPNLDKNIGDNDQLRLCYLAGKIMQRCTAGVDDIKIVLRQIVADCALTDVVETSITIKDCVQEIQNKVVELIKSSKKAEEERQKIKHTSDEKEIENSLLLNSSEQASKELAELKPKLEKLKKENEELTNKFQRLDSVDLQEAKKTVDSLNTELDEFRARCQQQDKENRLIQNNLAKAQQENKDLLQWLSQNMSAQLTYNNPNVADLSDPNRPTHLAEQYSELYDNEWTDAFQTLKSYQQAEDAIVGKLLYILCQAYEYCITAEQMQATLVTAGIRHPSTEKLKKMLDNLEKEYQKDCQSEEILDKQELQTIAQLSKKNAAKSAENLKQDFLQRLKVDNYLYLNPHDYRAYAEKCIGVCWSMVLQNPPLVIESSFDTVDSFDTKKYRFYQKSGKKYKYIVWPVLYLHKNGPILTQGVAEPDS